MKKFLSFAVRAAVGCALAGAAGAVTLPANYTGSNVIPISGATSTDGVLLDALLDATAGICTDDAAFGADVAEFYTTAAAPIDFTHPANYAVACKTKAGVPGLTSGATNVILKLAGGSGSGTGNVAAGTNLITSSGGVWADAIACKAAPPVAPVNNNAPLPGDVHVKVYTSCPSIGAGLVPKMGISDVEANLVGTSPANVAKLTGTKTVGVGFAPIVSKNFEIALQSLQGLAGCNGTAASQTAACLPSLSSAQLRGIFTGALNDAGFIVDNAGNPIAAPASGNTSIFVCRRSDTSGTQVTFQTTFLGQGCGSSPLTFVGGGGSAGAWAGNLAVNPFLGGGTSDVLACVAAHSVNGDYAVGIASTENAIDDTNANAFRYVKVDGQVPSLENTVAGNYSVFAENQFYAPNASSSNKLNGEQVKFATALPALLADPTRAKAHAVSFVFGHGGLLAIPDGNTIIPQNPPYTPLNTYVNTQVRSSAVGGATNSCAPANIQPGGILAPVGFLNN
jgi:hypothetical protein